MPEDEDDDTPILEPLPDNPPEPEPKPTGSDADQHRLRIRRHSRVRPALPLRGVRRVGQGQQEARQPRNHRQVSVPATISQGPCGGNRGPRRVISCRQAHATSSEDGAFHPCRALRVAAPAWMWPNPSEESSWLLRKRTGGLENTSTQLRTGIKAVACSPHNVDIVQTSISNHRHHSCVFRPPPPPPSRRSHPLANNQGFSALVAALVSRPPPPPPRPTICPTRRLRMLHSFRRASCANRPSVMWALDRVGSQRDVSAPALDALSCTK